MSKDEKIKIPDPFKIDMDFTLFAAIKYNRSLKDYKHEYDTREFTNFKRLFKEFLKKLNENNPTAFSDLSTLMSMWGYHRKYCGMCGRPVIGKVYRMQGGKIVCVTCYGSYKITEKLFEKDADEEIKEKASEKTLEQIDVENLLETKSENATTK